MTGSGLRIGKLLGIEIAIDWSWLFIFALITWNLATVFAQLHPAWAGGLNWVIALVASLLFFASVLAHEMAHSLVARSRGMPVRRITLFLFGGVSNLQREPETPGSEFIMAILGPVTSIVIGVGLLLLGGLLAGPLNGNGLPDPGNVLSRLGPLNTILLWLGSVNLVLGIFNLLPAFPLDGGRVVRSILWGATDNLRAATRWATWGGQIIAWLMILAGISMVFGVTLPILGGGLINGVWLAFIGWFLSNAASQSYRQAVVRDMLQDVPVTRLMRRDPPTVSPLTTVSSLVHDSILGTDDYGFPVVDGPMLVGIVTLQDVREVPRERWETTLVRDIMTPGDELLTVGEDACAVDALDQLMQKDIRQVPVVHNGLLLGLVRRNDIVKWLQMETRVG